MNWTKIKRDTNHKAVADYLRGAGVEVREIFDPVDLLCCRHSFVGLIEVKLPGSRTKYTRKQLQFIADTRMPVCIAKSGEEAYEFMRTGNGLSRAQKVSLRLLLDRNVRELYQPSVVESALAV